MPDDVEPVVRGIQKRFRNLSVDVREERVLRYIVNQLRQGRHMDDILADPYLTTHTDEPERIAILQNPAVIRAIEEETHKQFARYQSAAESAAGTPPSSRTDPKDNLDDPAASADPADSLGDNPGDYVKCPACGFANSPDSNFCRRCGNRLIPVDPSETTLSYTLPEQDTGAGGVAAVPRGTILLIRAGGGREGEIITLGGDVLTIGRSPHSDLFLDDVTVSRHHARILHDENEFWVEDLNSLNGTYVNRKRIERHRLSDGDELQIGKFKLAFLEREERI
jgi:hypothetical protein